MAAVADRMTVCGLHYLHPYGEYKKGKKERKEEQ